MPPSSQQQGYSIEELRIIDQVIRSAKRPTYRRIEEELQDRGYPGIQKRSIQRRLRYMRERYDAAAVISRRTTNPVTGRVEYLLEYARDWVFDAGTASEEELRVLQFARDLFKFSYNHPAAADIDEAYHKLLDASEISSQEAAEHVPEPIAFAHVAEQKVERAVWRHLLIAARKKRYVEITYSSRLSWSGQKRPPAVVKPYYLVNLGGTWYLLGSGDREVRGIQQYHLSRIEEVKILQATFTHPEHLDIDEILENTFHQFIGDYKDLVDVTIRFSPAVAPLVLDHVFHPKQRTKIDEQSKTVTLTFPVTPYGVTRQLRFYHVRSWILQWGADAEVIEPQELKELVSKDVGRMWKKISGQQA